MQNSAAQGVVELHRPERGKDNLYNQVLEESRKGLLSDANFDALRWAGNSCAR